MKIYTKTGDAGETGLFGGRRVSKSDLRVDAYGCVDELNAVVGVLMAYLSKKQKSTLQLLEKVQNNLFVVGSLLASDPEKPMPLFADITEVDILDLEKAIDSMEKTLPPLKNFILPGGTKPAAYAHLARTVCRRAERVVVALSLLSEVKPILITYLNRLSDYFFVLSRFVLAEKGKKEIIWKTK